MNYYKRHIGDYMKDASHLSLLEHGVYMRLLDVYYTRECAIPVDQAARLISARTKEEKAAIEAVVREFFTVVDGAYTQTRCDSEIAAMQHKTETNREVGRLGGRPRKETKTVSDGNPEITQTVSEKNPNITLATSHKPITNTPKAPKGADVRFDAFWRAYPNRVGKDAARTAFDKRKVDDDLLALMLSAIAAQSKSEKWTKDGGQFIPNPSTWLNQGRWQDEPDSGQQSVERGSVGMAFV